MVFVKPPLDGSLSMVEIYDFHWWNNPNHPLFKYERFVDGMTGETEVETITWAHAVRAIHNAVAYVERVCTNQSGSAMPQGSVVGILANLDTFTYFVLIAGIMRAGYIPLPISPRNPATSIVHLLRETGARHLLASSDPGIQRLGEAVALTFNNSLGGGAGQRDTGSRTASAAGSPLTPDNVPHHGLGLAGPPTPRVTPGPPLLDGLQFSPAPTFDFLFDGFDDSFEPPRPVPHTPSEDTVLILHSSGTMSLPKPIHFNSVINTFNGQTVDPKGDFSSQVWSCHSIPMFHAMGVVLMTWTMAVGFTISSFPPEALHILPNPDRLLASACASGSDTLLCAPSYLEAWCRSTQHVETLKTFKRVFYAGAPLYADTGDYLSSLGVRLCPFYGATEFGIPIDVPAEPEGSLEDWEYFQLSTRRYEVELIPSHEDVFLLVILAEPFKRSHVLNYYWKSEKMYNTMDLLQRHPTKPYLWRVYGRADEQITHSTLEKTNPVPIELRLKKHPKILNAMVFGQGRPLPGVLIEIRPEFLPKSNPAPSPVQLSQVQSPSLACEREKLLNEIWFYMDQINEFSPTHSRVVQDMLLLADPSKPFVITAKGTAKKETVLKDYEKEIEEAYQAAQFGSLMPGVPSPEAWEFEECLELVRRIVCGIMQEDDACSTCDPDDVKGKGRQRSVIGDDADLIAMGCDSIKVARIKNTVLSALHHGAKVSCRRVPHNIVYANPTIRKLGTYVGKIVVQGHGLVPGGVLSQRIAEMEDMVRRYTQNVPGRAPGRKGRRGRGRGQGQSRAGEREEDNKRGDVVLLTGSTGATAAHVLERLVNDQNVDKVYVLNRPDKHRRCQNPEHNPSGSASDTDHSTPAERHEGVFNLYGLDSSVLMSDKVIFLEGQLPEYFLGLQPATYVRLQMEVTCVIHAGWPSNLSAHLSSLEPLVAGTRNLLDFAIGSRLSTLPRFVFVSTMFIFSNWVGGPRSPEIPNTRPTSALGQGYGESKWVAERVIDIVADEVNRTHSPLEAVIVRVGHVSGGRNGAWDSRAWVPRLVRGAVDVGCLPRAQGDITWIPVHLVAAIILEIALPRPSGSNSAHNNPGSPTNRYFNLTHPNPVSVDVVFSALAHHLGVPLVAYETWLAALHANAALNSGVGGSNSSSSSSSGAAGLAGLPGLSTDPPVSGNSLRIQTSTTSTTLHSPSSVASSRTRSPRSPASPSSLSTQNAALPLLDFFRALYKPVKPWSKDKEAFGFPLAQGERSMKASPTLAGLAEMDVGKEVGSWVRGWKGAGIL